MPYLSLTYYFPQAFCSSTILIFFPFLKCNWLIDYFRFMLIFLPRISTLNWTLVKCTLKSQHWHTYHIVLFILLVVLAETFHCLVNIYPPVFNNKDLQVPLQLGVAIFLSSLQWDVSCSSCQGQRGKFLKWGELWSCWQYLLFARTPAARLWH